MRTVISLANAVFSGQSCELVFCHRFHVDMALTYVDKLRETDTDDGDKDDQPPMRKQRKPDRIWLQQQSFDTPKEAQEAVAGRKIWKICSKKDTTSGTRVNYRCTAGKFRTGECPAGLYLLYQSTSNEVGLQFQASSPAKFSVDRTH
jgi:hypothetical protein